MDSLFSFYGTFLLPPPAQSHPLSPSSDAGSLLPCTRLALRRSVWHLSFWRPGLSARCCCCQPSGWTVTHSDVLPVTPRIIHVKRRYKWRTDSLHCIPTMCQALSRASWWCVRDIYHCNNTVKEISDWPKGSLRFFRKMALVALRCLQLCSKQFCQIVLWQLSYQRAFKKKLIRNGEFLCSHFNTEDGRKTTLLAYYALLFQER